MGDGGWLEFRGGNFLRTVLESSLEAPELNDESLGATRAIPKTGSGYPSQSYGPRMCGTKKSLYQLAANLYKLVAHGRRDGISQADLLDYLRAVEELMDFARVRVFTGWRFELCWESSDQGGTPLTLESIRVLALHQVRK